MSDSTFLVKPKRHATPGSAQLLSTTPRGRASDDFFSHLEPATVVDAFALPSGVLRACLEGASVTERDFAMRAAMASQRIWEWLSELGQWSWPSEGGPDGFEKPSGTQRKLFVQVTAPPEDITTRREYMGSLLADDVARYEVRVDEILRDMDELDVEEIKGHVLTDYILPLSRPSTPILDPNQSVLSVLSSYNKLEDLSVIITAIVVQTLPNLARLTLLLQIWSMRLIVLQHVNPFLQALQHAEVLLEESWEAISTPSWARKNLARDEPTTLTRQDFEARMRALAQAVAQPARTLDHMLDCLEGSPDTLPEDWLNRMEDVEQGYSEWVAAWERKISAAEWAKVIESRQASRSPPLARDLQLLDDNTSQPSGSRGAELSTDTIIPPASVQPIDAANSVKMERDDGVSLRPMETDSSVSETRTPPSKNKSAVSLKRDFIANIDGARDDGSPLSLIMPPRRNLESEYTFDQEQPGGAKVWSEDVMDYTMSPVDEEDEFDLPPLRNTPRRGSLASQTSTVIHGTPRYFDDLSSDLPDISASPAVPKSRLREAFFPDELSPPSSPPEAQSRIPEPSVGLLDSPMITAIPEDDELFLKSTIDASFLDDFDDSFAVSELSDLPIRRESVGDEQLRAQISQIIESIPAKIRLATEPPAINLNPPDLVLPRLKKKQSKEPVRRSTSALSNRTATPSFTLAPAKTRTRYRGHQPIRVYHLSRSNGDAPIKLFIRCVGEHGERVMVRVGGGWADLAEYLKEYASHHGRRSGKDKAKVEIRDMPRGATGPAGSSPPSRPASVAGDRSSMSPLAIRKTRRSMGAMGSEAPNFVRRPKTPANSGLSTEGTPPSNGSVRSRSSSRSWFEDESSFLGLAGPRAKKIEMSEENRAWVESVKEKVRLVSGERRGMSLDDHGNRFGELGKVGGTKRVFRKT